MTSKKGVGDNMSEDLVSPERQAVDQPLISVVIPAYNVEQYLEACVTSVLAGRRDNIEVILVDDGSTDGTPALCERLAATYDVIRVVHKANGGLPAARNIGFAHAQGEWIWFVDSDDLVASHAMDYLLHYASKSDADALQFGFVRVQSVMSTSNFVEQYKVADVSDDIERKDGEKFLLETIRGLHDHYAWSFLLRRRLLNEYGQKPFSEEFSLYEDVVSIERLLPHARFVDCTDTVLYGYRISPSSMVHKCSDSAADSGLRAVKKLDTFELPRQHAKDRLRMQISFLFCAYKISKPSTGPNGIRAQIANEIINRTRKVGVFSLGAQRLMRYALLRSGFMNVILRWRSRHAA